MNIEKKRIEGWSTGKGSIGHITLDKLAVPETVKVTLLGETIIPESFNCYGYPNFTEEQEMLYMFKENELKRLNEFMLFGCFWLDQFGQIMSVEKTEKGKLKTNGDVEDYETFKRHNSKGFTLISAGYAIPTAGSVCPCCGKKLTIDDVKNNPCVYIDGKFYHDSCWRNYRKLTEVDNFTRRMMNLIYESTDYHFELLPNSYCHKDCCSHIPWFLFHTIDGDIIMGWRKHVISIEWQENYKAFDMNELFGTENVTKWEKSGKRGIHARDNKKAIEYLKKVLNTVNPSYSK